MLTTKSAHRKDLTTGLSDMQHRHFATIATIIREIPVETHGPDHTSDMKRRIAHIFADRLASTNSNFDRDRFLRACLHREDA